MHRKKSPGILSCFISSYWRPASKSHNTFILMIARCLGYYHESSSLNRRCCCASDLSTFIYLKESSVRTQKVCSLVIIVLERNQKRLLRIRAKISHTMGTHSQPPHRMYSTTVSPSPDDTTSPLLSYRKSMWAPLLYAPECTAIAFGTKLARVSGESHSLDDGSLKGRIITMSIEAATGVIYNGHIFISAVV